MTFFYEFYIKINFFFKKTPKFYDFLKFKKKIGSYNLFVKYKFFLLKIKTK